MASSRAVKKVEVGRAERQDIQFSFTGRALCLDFVNTAGSHLSTAPREGLRSYRDLVAWTHQANLVGEDLFEALLRRGGRRPARAEAVLVEAVELREALFRIFLAARAGEIARRSDVRMLNARVRMAMGESELVPSSGGFTWGWPRPDRYGLDWILWPVARSAATLLSSDALAHLAICASEQCGWLFLDATQRRRWCSMQFCGNRAKAARYYERTASRPEATTRHAP